MASNMQVGSYATLDVTWADKGGNPAKVDGPTKWESTAPDICQVTVATGNPLIANLFAPGPVGNAQIHATADADLGEGTKTITSTYDITVISGEAVGGEITFSQNVSQGGPPPQAKPAAAASTSSGKAASPGGGAPGSAPAGTPGGAPPKK